MKHIWLQISSADRFQSRIKCNQNYYFSERDNYTGTAMPKNMDNLTMITFVET